VNPIQKVVSVVVGLVIVVGGYGCRYALREAAEDRSDKIVEDATEAFEESYVPPSIPRVTTPPTTEAPEATTPETTAPSEITTPATTEPAAPTLPKGWPAELEPVEGLTIESSSDVTGPSIVGTVAGDVAGVTETIRADLAAAGFAVDATRSVGGVTIATGAAGEMTVLVAPEAAGVRVTYRLTPA
jgi:hypothetical protein